MKAAKLQILTSEQLVSRFSEIALQQDQAELENDYSTVGKLFWQLEAIEQVLKERAGDQRRALLHLYNHSNAQVRLKAALATLAIAPVPARLALQAIADSKEYPQAGEAGMSLINLDRGIFKPT